MKSKTSVWDKKIAIVALVYFLAGIILLLKFDIQLGGEADKYIENANRVIRREGFFNGIFGNFYIVYTLLVALFLKLSVDLFFLALLQLLLSFLAALCLYKLLKEGLSDEGIAFSFFIIYLLCYPVQKWNFYLYSESVHSSLLVIGVYCFYKWVTNRKLKSMFVSIAVLVLIFFSRPVGLLFLISLLFVLLLWLHRNKKPLQFYILLSGLVVSGIILLNSPYTAFVNPDSIRRMEIICQVPEASTDTIYKEYNREGLIKAFTVIKNEVGFGIFFKTGFKKLASFFGMYRTYYSWQHNLLLICFTILYPFALVGIFTKKQGAFGYVKVLAITYLLLTSIGIFFTCDEWSNRFISAAFPFILILAAGGVALVLARFKRSPKEINL